MSTEVATKPLELDLFIGGKFEKSSSGKTFDVINPATGEVMAVVQEGGKEDIDKAVKAAREAFPAWSELPGAARSIMLNKLADLLDAQKNEFGLLESMNTGKPMFESVMVDLTMTVDCIRFYAAAARMLRGETVPVPGGRPGPRFAFLYVPVPVPGGRPGPRLAFLYFPVPVPGGRPGPRFLPLAVFAALLAFVFLFAIFDFNYCTNYKCNVSDDKTTYRIRMLNELMINSEKYILQTPLTNYAVICFSDSKFLIKLIIIN